MSVGLPSDEVAEDYKNSLEDLTINSRYEISNLTVIAKENTEHAVAISRVLENHIRNTPPARKLPALYVLDSIVKNVGTPYTLFLGHNLYNTFMNAYSLVDSHTRKKLDEMLKTWKEPVPGSLDLRPVFSVETTRPIENALIKARTLAVQQQQQQAKTQQELLGRNRSTPNTSTAWRNTPTPPQSNGRQAVPGAQGYPPQNLPNGNMQQVRESQHQCLGNSADGQAKTRSAYPPYQPYPRPQQPPSSFQPNYQVPTSYSPAPQSASNLASLHRDIEALITAARNEFAATPWEPAIQQRLKALLDLQTIVLNQQLPPDQILLIQTQVAQLSNSQKVAMPAPAPAPIPAAAPAPAPAPMPNLAAPSVQQQPNLQALFSSNALAGLLASAAKAQQAPATPPVHQVQLPPTQLPPSQPLITPSPIPAGGENPLIASLRAAGMLPPTPSTSINGAVNAAPAPFVYPPPSTALQTPPIPSMTLPPPFMTKQNDVQLTSASLKIPRPHLISSIYEAQPNQCSTCGRRFLATEEGRAKKARHLDWHFRTNQRLADSARRGQSRSWYVDEMEWIKSRDNNEEEASGLPKNLEASRALAAAIAAKNDPKNKFIPVPNDSVLASAPCPICQEKFETSWNEDAQDFVWMDAIKIGSKVYHGTCYAELKKDGAITPLRTPTPESVLGKRKAGMSDINGIRSKLPKEIKA